jgi:hypothetical protein
METVPEWMAYPIGKGKPFDDVQFTPDEFKQSVAKTSQYYDTMNPNLKPFRANGGKLLVYQGWADGLLPPSTTLDYYNAMRKVMGGQQQTDQFARLFMVNGMGHCPSTDYPSPDGSELIYQMVQWVEKGQAPESIVVSDRAGERKRPAFRYPMVAKYVGPDPASDPTGPDQVQNFVAAAPDRQHDDATPWIGDYRYKQPPTTN